jgi:hypothetical protein
MAGQQERNSKAFLPLHNRQKIKQKREQKRGSKSEPKMTSATDKQRKGRIQTNAQKKDRKFELKKAIFSCSSFMFCFLPVDVAT